MGYEFSVLKPLHHEGVYWNHQQLGHNMGLVVGSSSECSVFEHVESIFLGQRVMFDKEIIINKTKSNVYKMH